MKRLLTVLIIAEFLGGNMISAQPAEVQTSRSDRIAAIEHLLLDGLWSDDPSQLRGATFAVRRLTLSSPDYDWDRFIIPLMHVVNDDRHDPGARIMAAVALHDLRSDRADFLIAQEARFCEDCCVRRYCQRLAHSRAAEQRGSFAAQPSEAD